jgi:hypothetical protein
MNRQRRLATWMGAILGVLCALALTAQGQASDRSGKVSEEFHHSYPLAAGGRVELNNINGAVHITAWDQNEVKLDAVKYADSKERLDSVKIDVDSDNSHLSIRTKFRDNDYTGPDVGRGSFGVEYTLTIPRAAWLDEIRLINGPLDIHGMGGEVRASCINGTLTADGLQGRAELKTINGKLETRFEQPGSSPIELSSVNGSVELTLPSDVKADVEASTVSGGISSDFGFHVINHHWVGHELRGELGGGGTRIRLSNVNGHIEIRHANDGRAISPVKDLTHQEKDDDEI